MNKEIKQKWIDALRSGNYQQGKGALRRNNRYCCLGVLCEVLGIKGIESDILGGLFAYNHKITHLPDEAYEMSEITGGAEGYPIQDLVCMNDDGASFDEIASWIEDNL